MDTLLTESNKEFLTKRGAQCGGWEHSVRHVINLLSDNTPLSSNFLSEKKSKVKLQWRAAGFWLIEALLYLVLDYLDIIENYTLIREFKKNIVSKNIVYWPSNKFSVQFLRVINTVNQRVSKYVYYCAVLLIIPLIWCSIWNGVERLNLSFISGNSSRSERVKSRHVSSSHSGFQ